MPRDSRSPPRRQSRHTSERDRSPPRERSRRSGGHDHGEEYGRRGKEDNGWGDRGNSRHHDRRGDDRRPAYDERQRNKERERDRETYDRNGGRNDRAGGSSSRRSASPSRRSRPLPGTGERSQSPSGSKSPSAVDKAKPNFAPSGLLAAATNTVQAADGTSTVLKYNEPPEARKPILSWRLYVFKGSEQVDLMHIHRQSAYLIGRDKTVADITIDHPSCSKQHAVIQYRFVQEKDEYGVSKGTIKPFIIDLESTNGTHVNDERIPESRYYELKASDVVKFGQSTREYVLLHEDAK